MQLHLGSLRVTRRCSARPPNNWIFVCFSISNLFHPCGLTFSAVCSYVWSQLFCPVLPSANVWWYIPGHSGSSSSCFLSLEPHLCLSCWTCRSLGVKTSLRVPAERSPGYFGIFLIVTTCLDDCDALSPCGTQSSLTHAHSLRLRVSKPRFLTQARSVTVRDSSHGTLPNHLKPLWAVCAREQVCIHLNLCTVSIIRMIYST